MYNYKTLSSISEGNGFGKNTVDKKESKGYKLVFTCYSIFLV